MLIGALLFIGVVIFLYYYLIYPVVRLPSEEELIAEREHASQPLSSYNYDYYEKYKGADYAPCIHCNTEARRVTMVITSQGFKCGACAHEDMMQERLQE